MDAYDTTKTATRGSDGQKFRNVLKEHRGDYFVEYHCASPVVDFAVLNVIFLRRASDFPHVRKTMEQELEIWLRRYPVPIMASGIDEKEDGISFSSELGGSALMGFIEPRTGKITHRWGLAKDWVWPADQLREDYWDEIYRDVPFRWANDVRKKADRNTRNVVRAGKALVFFIVAVPVLIEIVALGYEWLGHLLSAISIGVGLYKVGKALGWLKPSEGDKAQAREELAKAHHHYHCEKNPRAFEKLRAENYAHDAAERIRREEARLRTGEKLPEGSTSPTA